MNLHISGLRKLLGLPSDDAEAPDSLRDPKTQMAIALNATKRSDQVYGGTVPPAVKGRRRAANRRARASRQINRGNR